MPQATNFLTQEQQDTIETATADAENKTAAEIVTAIASASGRYDRGEDIAGLWLGSIAMITLWILWPIPQSQTDTWVTAAAWPHYAGWLAALIIGFILGATLTSKGTLRLLFTPKREQQQQVEQKAREVFFDQRINRTQDSTGVLIYISLAERMVTILADDTALGHLGQATIQQHCTTLMKTLGSDPVQGLTTTIQTLADTLATPLPRQSNDRNELSNKIQFID